MVPRIDIFRQLLLTAAGAESGEFRKMTVRSKAKILGNLAFLSTQLLVGKFLSGSALLAGHEAMAALSSIQAALHKSAAG